MLKYRIQKNDGIFIRFANAAIIFSHVVSGGVEGKHIHNILNRGLIIWGPGALMRSVKSGPGDTSYLSTRRYNTCTGVYYFAFIRMTGRSGEIIILLSSRCICACVDIIGTVTENYNNTDKITS